MTVLSAMAWCALAGTHETLTANHTALLIRFFLVVLALSLNGQVTILQLSLDIALLKARHIQIQLIVIVIFLYVAIHQTLCALARSRHIEHIIKHIRENIAKQHNNPSIEITLLYEYGSKLHR